MPSLAPVHVRRGARAAALSLCVAAACYEPAFQDRLPCTPEGRCPDGQACAADGICYRDDEQPPCFLAGAFDTKLIPQSPLNSDLLGESVALSGDIAIVGDPLDDTAAINAGAAYVFRRASGDAPFVPIQQLIAGDATPESVFGHEAVLTPTLAVIASPQDATVAPAQGSAYVFEFDGTAFRPAQKLVPSVTVGQFGAALAATDTTIAVAAGVEDVVFVFERQGGGVWNEVAQLPVNGMDLFAGDLALFGDTLFVGTPGDSTNGPSAGAVFVFERRGGAWSQVQKLFPNDAAPEEDFGWTVDVDSEFAVVGATLDDNDGGADAGAAYVFARAGDQWIEFEKLVASDGKTGDLFAESASIDIDQIAISALNDDDGATDGGSVYLFQLREGTWIQTAQLVSPDVGVGDSFGISLALDRGTVVVGSPNNEAIGAGYTFALSCE